MSNSNKALFAVIGLIIIIGGMVAFVGSGNNGGMVPTPMATPMMTATPTAMATATPTASGSTVGMEKADVELTVNGGMFYYKPDVLKVKKGQTVKVTFVNDGGWHDFNIDELNVHSEVIKETGAKTSVTFVADKAGTFEYYCSVMEHRQKGQVGKITVE